MIYLCSLPGQICKALTNCSWIGKLLDQFAKLKRSIGCHKPPFPKKPCCTFVLMHGGLSFCHLCICMAALEYKDTECTDSDPNVILGFANFLYIQIVFAFISLAFAPYLFVRLWSRILRKCQEPGFEPEPLPPAEDQKYKMVRVKLPAIKAAFKEQFLYDITVLIYFLCVFGNMILGWMAPNSITHAADCPHAEQVRSFAITYFFADFWYVPFWWCCLASCMFKGVDAEVPWPEGEGSVQATVVGVPATQS